MQDSTLILQNLCFKCKMAASSLNESHCHKMINFLHSFTNYHSSNPRQPHFIFQSMIKAKTLQLLATQTNCSIWSNICFIIFNRKTSFVKATQNRWNHSNIYSSSKVMRIQSFKILGILWDYLDPKTSCHDRNNQTRFGSDSGEQIFCFKFPKIQIPLLVNSIFFFFSVFDKFYYLPLFWMFEKIHHIKTKNWNAKFIKWRSYCMFNKKIFNDYLD